jgi:hypothetical protein
MKSLFASFLVLLSLSVTAGTLQQVPECKDVRGNVMNGSMDQLRVVMRSNSARPQVMVTGVVSQILPEDHDGLPHQKFSVTVDKQVTLLIVSNLDFGRIPLTVGKAITVCGEYKKVGQGMIHWTHFDPHGGHPDGYTVVDGQLYGDTESSDQGAQDRQNRR